MTKSLSYDMILPKFGEYNYYHEDGLFLVRDTVAVYKKEVIINN